VSKTKVGSVQLNQPGVHTSEYATITKAYTEEKYITINLTLVTRNVKIVTNVKIKRLNGCVGDIQSRY
jgi:hypothetical protein